MTAFRPYPPDWLDEDGAAYLLCLPVSTFREYVAESDLTAHQIGSITGQTIQTVQHYSKGASQKRLAKEAMKKLEGRGE